MKKIGIEKENIARIAADSIFLICSMVGLFSICEENLNRWYLIIPIVFIFVFIIAIISEAYECIFFDDTHLVIRTLRKTTDIDFADIERIKRDYITNKTVLHMGHWRYTMKIKTKDQNTKEIIVPFPQLIENQHLQDLFSRIKKQNKNIEWVKVTPEE